MDKGEQIDPAVLPPGFPVRQCLPHHLRLSGGLLGCFVPAAVVLRQGGDLLPAARAIPGQHLVRLGGGPPRPVQGQDCGQGQRPAAGRAAQDPGQEAAVQYGAQGCGQDQQRQAHAQKEGKAALLPTGALQCLPPEGPVGGRPADGLLPTHPVEAVVQGLPAGLLIGLLGLPQRPLTLAYLLLQHLQVLQLSLGPLQLLPLRQGAVPGLFPFQSVSLPPGSLQILPCLGVPAVQLQGIQPVVGSPLRLQDSLPALQLRLFPLQAGQGPVGLLQPGEHRPGLGQLPLQSGDQAHALVHLPPVQPLPQLPLRLGKGHVLLPGGNQGGDAPLQLRHGGDGQGAPLAHESGAFKDLLPHPQQELAAGVAGQAGHRLLGTGVDGGECPKGAVPLTPPAQGDVPPVPGEDQLPLHGGPGPGLVAVLVRQIALPVPVPGIDAVEHGLQKARPGGFSPLVGGLDHIQSGAQLQPRPLQPPEGGCHAFDLHSATSSPCSKAASPNRTASCTASFSGSA